MTKVYYCTDILRLNINDEKIDTAMESGHLKNMIFVHILFNLSENGQK
jgi:hypothetical protein